MSTYRRAYYTPSGGRFTVSPWGQHFARIEIDRFRTGNDWPEPTAGIMCRLAEPLSWLALYGRGNGTAGTSSFASTGYLLVPREAVPVFEYVMLEADAGEVGPALLVLPHVEAAWEWLHQYAQSKTARRAAASAVINGLCGTLDGLFVPDGHSAATGVQGASETGRVA